MWDVDPDTQAGAGRAPERVPSVPCSLRSAYLYRPRAVWHVLTRVRLMSGTRQAYFEITPHPRVHTTNLRPDSTAPVKFVGHLERAERVKDCHNSICENCGDNQMDWTDSLGACLGDRGLTEGCGAVFCDCRVVSGGTATKLTVVLRR